MGLPIHALPALLPTLVLPAVGQGWVDPGYMHRAVLAGLKPSTTYVYQVHEQHASTPLPLQGQWEAEA